MSVRLCLILFLAIALGVHLTVQAQTYDLELSTIMVFGMDGISQEESSFQGSISTEFNGIHATLSLSTAGASFGEGSLTLEGSMQDIQLSSVTSFDSGGFTSEAFEVQGTAQGVAWTSTTVLTPAGFGGQTLEASVQQEALTLGST